MAKFTKLLIIIIGLTLGFHFTGLTHSCDDNGLCEGVTPNSKLLNLLLNIRDINLGNLTDIKDVLDIALLGAAGVGIAISFFVAGRPELAIASPFVVALLALAWDIIYIYSRVAESNPIIALLLFAPIMFILIPTAFEYFRGITQ